MTRSGKDVERIIRFPRPLYGRLKDYAAVHGRSANAEVLLALEAHLPPEEAGKLRLPAGTRVILDAQRRGEVQRARPPYYLILFDSDEEAGWYPISRLEAEGQTRMEDNKMIPEMRYVMEPYKSKIAADEKKLGRAIKLYLDWRGIVVRFSSGEERWYV